MIKLINLNFWMGKRLEDSLAFLQRERDRHTIITLQEVEEKDITTVEKALSGMHAVYGPMHLVGKKNPPANRVSVAVFSDQPLEEPFSHHYATFNMDKPYDWWRTNKPLMCPLAGGTYRLNGAGLRVATTHFTWVGLPCVDAEQQRALPKLLGALKSLGVDVLTCDLNSPRKLPNGNRGEIWSHLATHFRDNIPEHVERTLEDFHPATLSGDILIVDGLFSSASVLVSEVNLHKNVSDHCGITAMVKFPKG